MRFKKKIYCFSLLSFWTLFGLAFFCVLASFTFAQDNRQLVLEKPPTSDKRIALVIGNGAYTKAKTLPNPANDAIDMAAALKTLGFEVISGTDQNKRQMETLIREFGSKLANGGVGLFYYAGHGIQVNGYNYLVPVDADIPEENEVKYAAVPMNFILDKMETANNSLNIVILDACRNNPFARSWRNYRDIGDASGLARVTPPQGTLVIYATQPGNVASDGTGRNGLFTASLLRQIKKPNLELDPLIKALTRDVAQASGNKQYPWREGTFTGGFYFSVSTVSQSIPPLATQSAVPKPTPLSTPVAVSQVDVAQQSATIGAVPSRLLTGGEPVTQTKPEFPPIARGMSGTVKIELSIDKKGNVTNARPVSGPSAFYQASITAALSSKFRPTLSEGKPIAVIREYSYSFDDGSRTPCGDRPLRILSKPRPEYTVKGRDKNVQGTVILRVTFLDNGEIGVVDVNKALTAGLTTTAIEAAKKITFIPACKDSIAVTVTKSVEYTYDIY